MPNEMIETLWSLIENGVAYICVFIPVRHKGAPEEVNHSQTEVEAQELEARTYRLEVLGSIHTHPDRDETIFSEGDLRELQRLPELVMGICAIEIVENKRRKCHIAYWPGVMPMVVEYTDWSRANGLQRRGSSGG